MGYQSVWATVRLLPPVLQAVTSTHRIVVVATGFGVPHAHVHLMQANAGREVFGQWGQSLSVSKDELALLAAKVRREGRRRTGTTEGFDIRSSQDVVAFVVAGVARRCRTGPSTATVAYGGRSPTPSELGAGSGRFTIELAARGGRRSPVLAFHRRPATSSLRGTLRRPGRSDERADNQAPGSKASPSRPTKPGHRRQTRISTPCSAGSPCSREGRRHGCEQLRTGGG